MIHTHTHTQHTRTQLWLERERERKRDHKPHISNKRDSIVAKTHVAIIVGYTQVVSIILLSLFSWILYYFWCAFSSVLLMRGITPSLFVSLFRFVSLLCQVCALTDSNTSISLSLSLYVLEWVIACVCVWVWRETKTKTNRRDNNDDVDDSSVQQVQYTLRCGPLRALQESLDLMMIILCSVRWMENTSDACELRIGYASNKSANFDGRQRRRRRRRRRQNVCMCIDCASIHSHTRTHRHVSTQTSMVRN